MSKNFNKKKLNAKDIAIQRFIHLSCCPTSDGKRFKEMRFLFSSQFEFNENDYLKIWKGLFYIVWYSEMNKSGQDVIFEMVYYCPFKNLNLYFIAGFKLLTLEWFGIDYLRIDKYAHLVRHMINRILKWIIFESQEDNYKVILDILNSIESNVDLYNHFTEIYIQELNRCLMYKVIWDHQEKVKVLFKTLNPFIIVLSKYLDKRSIDAISEFILDEIPHTIIPRESQEVGKNLLYQLSDELVNVGKDEKVNRRNRNLMYKFAKQYKSLAEKIKE